MEKNLDYLAQKKKSYLMTVKRIQKLEAVKYQNKPVHRRHQFVGRIVSQKKTSKHN